MEELKPKRRSSPLSAGAGRPALMRQAAERSEGMARKTQLTDFGIRVKSELDRRGMTQRELAKQCGINFRVVNDVLMGRNRKEENIKLIRETLAIPS